MLPITHSQQKQRLADHDRLQNELNPRQLLLLLAERKQDPLVAYFQLRRTSGAKYNQCLLCEGDDAGLQHG